MLGNYKGLAGDALLWKHCQECLAREALPERLCRGSHVQDEVKRDLAGEALLSKPCQARPARHAVPNSQKVGHAATINPRPQSGRSRTPY